jgi:hypothetical protein
LEQYFSIIVSLCTWIPIGIGIWRFKDLERALRIFLAYLILGAALDHSAIMIRDITTRNSIQDAYSWISSVLLLLMMNEWILRIEPVIKYKHLAIIITLIMLIDHFLRPVDRPKIPWGYLICSFIVIIQALNHVSTELTFEVGIWYKQSRLLVLLPIIIQFLYFTILMLLMSMLYTPESQKFFLRMFQIINILSIFKYTTFSLALLWVPKKEKFL